SIYNLWREVLEYFHAYLICLTATPSKQTIGLFNKNLVMEYGHEHAVTDNVNVPYDGYKIDTGITVAGSGVDKGVYVEERDRLASARAKTKRPAREAIRIHRHRRTRARVTFLVSGQAYPTRKTYRPGSSRRSRKAFRRQGVVEHRARPSRRHRS